MTGMIKSGIGYNDIYNYRNSKYFINTVIQAKKWVQKSGRDLAIFAGACQSYYEALVSAGANFASSPARVLIDFMDPLIVAEKIATTDEYKYLTIKDIEDELRDGDAGIGRYRCKRKETQCTNLTRKHYKLQITTINCNINVTQKKYNELKWVKT